MLKNKNIVLGVTGGIAVYKVVDVVSRLKKLGANIDVIMTESATKFVTPLTFQSMSQNFVTVDMFKEPLKWEVEHISLAQRADLFVIAPATANIIGKIANGISDDMLSTTVMATTAKVVLAPAMNTQMYNNPIVQKNIKTLKALGYEFIKPGEGRLACGDYGPGKLAQPEEIVDVIVKGLSPQQVFMGKKFLITAGPTQEAFDPVRYMTNHSSGRMGYALAAKAVEMGADVTLISGPTTLEQPEGLDFVQVQTTDEMYSAVGKYFDDCDVLIKAAAPMDYRPKVIKNEKIKKDEKSFSVDFIQNPDILAHYGSVKTKQILVGFAAETHNLVEYAKEKLHKKNLDIIIANNILNEGAGFKTDTNIVTIIDKNGDQTELPKMTKEDLAVEILNKVAREMN